MRLTVLHFATHTSQTGALRPLTIRKQREFGIRKRLKKLWE